MAKISPKLKKQILHMKKIGKRHAAYIAEKLNTDIETVDSVK